MLGVAWFITVFGISRSQWITSYTPIRRWCLVIACAVVEALEHATPLQREDLARNYMGLKIDWNLRFHNARKLEDENSVQVSLNDESEDKVTYYTTIYLHSKPFVIDH